MVDLTNKNRQLPALDSTIDKPKVHVVAERMRDINSDVDLKVLQVGCVGSLSCYKICISVLPVI